jgi:hypothetical protein
MLSSSASVKNAFANGDDSVRFFYVFELEATAGRSEVEVDAPPA